MAHPPRAASGEFLAQNLDLSKPPAELQDEEGGVKSEALGRCNGQNEMVTCLLLLFLLLLLLLVAC